MNDLDLIDAEFVIACFEDATSTLMALPPGGFSTALVQSNSEIVRDMEDVLTGAVGPSRPPAPAARKITAMDEIFSWLAFIPERQRVLRRIVALRSYTHRVTGKPKSWFSIAKIVGAHDYAVKRWHGDAISLIVVELNRRGAAGMSGFQPSGSDDSAWSA